MENIYNAYSKVIHGQTYFFVKKYLSFPEFNNVPDVLVGYGMHVDFDKACKIAMINNQEIKDRLRKMEQEQAPQAKIFNLPAHPAGVHRRAK